MSLSTQKLAQRLTFRQLQVFKAVYKSNSYSKAGEELGLTQPAVSQQIRQIEQSLEKPLFSYIGRKLYCTAVGERLSQSIDTIFLELESLQADLATLEGTVAGELKILAVSTAQYVVPYLLRDFIEQHPQISVSVRVVNRAVAMQGLDNNCDDLVIMGMVPANKPLSSLPFLDNELVPVVPAGHTLCSKKNITPQEFLDSQLLMREAGSGSRLAIERHCQLHHLRIQARMELGSNDAIKHAVIAGLGVAILPKLSILSELELGKIKLLNIEGFPLRRSWCVVHPQAKHLTPVMKAFMNYIQQNINHFGKIFSEEQKQISD